MNSDFESNTSPGFSKMRCIISKARTFTLESWDYAREIRNSKTHTPFFSNLSNLPPKTRTSLSYSVSSKWDFSQPSLQNFSSFDLHFFLQKKQKASVSCYNETSPTLSFSSREFSCPSD